MPSLSPVTLGQSWQLIYDASVSGDFVGGLNLIGGNYAYVRIATSIPSASANGWPLVGSSAVELSQANGDKLYGKSSGNAVVQLDSAQFPDSFPPGVFTGLRAITVQGYSEANVKNGLQFYIRAVWNKAGPIPSGQTRKIWFSTGASPIIVKSRVMEFDAEELRLDIFAGPTGVTGGTVITPRNYNRVFSIPAVSQAKKNVSTTADGAPFDPDDPEHFFGSSNSPQRTPGAILQGRERVLPANTEFIVAITNTGASNARVQYFLDYYQGGTDLPRPE